MKDVQEPEEVRFPRKISGQIYTDIQLRYHLNSRLSLYAGVNNLFDNKPPVHPDTFQGGTTLVPNAIIYDNIGRFFYLGFNIRFDGV